MIDMHTHILPLIDDGAKDVATAQALLRAEAEQGVSEMVFTPHYYGKKRSLKQFLCQRDRALRQIEPHVPQTIRWRRGAEVHMTGVNDPSNEKLCSLAIDGTKYVLIELPYSRRWNKSLFSRLETFISDTGYFPILAHVERYRKIRNNPSILNELVKKGCLIQLNVNAFLEKQTKGFAFALLKHGLVHCIGSDTHDTELRAPRYAEAKGAVETVCGENAWEEIQSNMRKILNGEILRVVYMPVRKFMRWYF